MGSMQDMDGRVGSAMGMDMEAEAEEPAKIGPPYDPLVPQMWQDRLRAFEKLNFIKFRRIFQSLFYLLQHSKRESICYEETN